MVPGFLHFNLGRGTTADMLLASMVDIIGHVKDINAAFQSMHMPEITAHLEEDAVLGLKGKVVQFYINGQLLRPRRVLKRSAKSPIKMRPQWNRSGAPCMDATHLFVLSSGLTKNPFLSSCLESDTITLKAIREPFLDKNLAVDFSSLALKILDCLECAQFTEQHLERSDALWLFCHLVALLSALSTLNPKFISATKIHLSDEESTLTKTLDLQDPIWARQILYQMPTKESSTTLPIDVLALSFIKTLVGQFGPRGESSILKAGFGLSPTANHLDVHVIEALWCELHMPRSTAELGPNNYPRISWLYEVSALVPAIADMAALSAMLSLHQAQALSYNLVSTERTTNCYIVRFLVNENAKREAIEALLVKADAKELHVSVVEHHELTKRSVSVPLGKGNKTDSARFHEYLYLDKTVRVEPFKEDIELYMNNTDYSVDVARADLLVAWKKWRGRMVEE